MPYPWSAGNVLTATDLNSAFAAKYDSAPAINAQVGTTYTFVLADATAGKTITASNASASTYTVPPQSSVAFSAGALLRVTNLGAGVVTFAGGVGVTVTNTAGTLAQYQTATLVRTGSDAWTVIPAGGASGLTLVATATASASSAVSINSCFTSLYDNYRIIADISSATTTSEPRLRLRVGGVDALTNYEWGGVAAVYSSVSLIGIASGVVSTTYYEMGSFSVAGGVYLIIDLIAPAAARRTGIYSNGVNTGANAQYRGGAHSTATAYDGFTLYPGSGTITTPTNGIRVYGYRNA